MSLDNPCPPCAGRWALFDSVELEDHRRARELCQACPLLASCTDTLNELRCGVPRGHGPSGTWAGQLLGIPKAAERARCADEEAIYDDAQARAAHAAFKSGDESEWAETGHRVYERRRHRRTRSRRAARRAGAAA